MYCNLSHYIVIAIVRSDRRGAARREASRRDKMGAAMQQRAYSLASPTHRRQPLAAFSRESSLINALR